MIFNGDHLQFELDNIGVPPKERPDWPFPSFDAQDWAEAFCKVFPECDEVTVLAWMACALMRGYDQRSMENAEKENQEEEKE